MPSPDPVSAAQALSSIAPEPDLASPSYGVSSGSSSPVLSPDSRPPWGQSAGVSTRGRSFSSARLTTSSGRRGRRATVRGAFTRLVRSSDKAGRNLLALFYSLPPVQRVAVAVGLIVVNVLLILFLVYSHAIFSWLAPISHKWRALPGGWILAWLICFFCAFPPVIGYSTSLTIAGFVYGFPLGWPIVATATVAGSTTAFFTSRTIFSKYVHRLVGQDHRFIALGQVLRKDGLGMLTAVRFCPLPYSISNGFLATIPSISPWSFAAASAIASPKLLVHVFIGSRLALIAEQGDQMTAGDKAINYASMIIGGLVGVGVGWLIYNRTMARAAELALDEANDHHGHADHQHQRFADATDSPSGRRGNADFDYADVEAGLVDPDDVAALMEEDDISLWANDEAEAGQYHDDDDVGTNRPNNGSSRK
ncbi:snare associated Golgi protein-domain-containing protein [Plectosphaerella plurivora]|uniref:Golgi apparatus membrane protein TVP38 n=1 Tax=Plectosphaerella plurivora TaxID=936078 RepID=A0A9P9ACZ6_9PEZI|nr:snare associated Golgi protein-domain-containing protein [Plectosphaerella plurivora]